MDLEIAGKTFCRPSGSCRISVFIAGCVIFYNVRNIMFELLLAILKGAQVILKENRFQKLYFVIRKRRRKLIALSLLVLVRNLADLNGGHKLTILMPAR